MTYKIIEKSLKGGCRVVAKGFLTYTPAVKRAAELDELDKDFWHDVEVSL